MPLEMKSLQLLRKQVQQQFGRPLQSARDCEELSAELEEDFKITISPQSIRRFFGLIKYTGGYSVYTLDSLAQYCGTVNYADFKNKLLHNELSSFFAEASGDAPTPDYWQLSEDLCRKIASSPELLITLHHDLLSYPLARQYFLEHHPMRDMAATVYTQYFHEYLKYNDDNEAKLFAYGFLFMGAFLSENTALMELYFQKVFETELTEEVYVLPAGRKYGVILLYADYIGNEKLFMQTWAEMLTARERYVDASRHSVCSFEYTVLEHLIYTDRTEEMDFLITHNTEQQYRDRKFVPQERKQSHDTAWQILCASAACRKNEKETCRQLLATVQLDRLDFGWRKYYEILYLFLTIHCTEPAEPEKLFKQLQLLIRDTHFSWYRHQLTQLELS